MDKITQEIEEMAEKMEKSVTDPKEKLQSVIKSLGKEGLKARLPFLSEEEKSLLKSMLTEMTLQKAVSFDDQYQAKFVQGNIKDTIIQEDKADDDQDEKLVKPAAAKFDHQGTPTDGWSGQVIKSLEDNLDEVIEKAMEKSGNDEEKVMEKLKGKGVSEEKVQGALDKFKKKKEMKKSEDLEKGKMKEKISEEDAKEEILEMEQKEHGTKDPKKLVEAEKKENMKKSIQTEIEPEETNQSGDAPDMNDGKQSGKKSSAPNIEALGKDNKKNMTKSVLWEDETRLLKANTLGRNFHFNVGQFIEETIKNEPKESITKSEGFEDLNDLIQKGKDRTWDQLRDSHNLSETKINGSLVKSFNDEDLAQSMGLSVEEMSKILE